jgi:hypothetical protein
MTEASTPADRITAKLNRERVFCIDANENVRKQTIPLNLGLHMPRTPAAVLGAVHNLLSSQFHCVGPDRRTVIEAELATKFDIPIHVRFHPAMFIRCERRFCSLDNLSIACAARRSHEFLCAGSRQLKRFRLKTGQLLFGHFTRYRI